MNHSRSFFIFVSDEAEKAVQNGEQDFSNERRSDDEILRILPTGTQKGRLHSSQQIMLDGQIREFFDMKCDICSDVEFESLLMVRQHYRTIHSRKGYLKCCGKKLVQRHEILKHIRYHIDPDSYRCDRCNKTFKDNKTLANHCDTHVPLDLREFKCNLCPKSFVKRHKLRGHIRLYHTFPRKTGKETSEQTFACDKCGKM